MYRPIVRRGLWSDKLIPSNINSENIAGLKIIIHFYDIETMQLTAVLLLIALFQCRKNSILQEKFTASLLSTN